MNQSARRQRLARIAPFAGVLIGLAGVAFVTRTLVTRWDDVRLSLSGVDVAALAGSVVVGLAAMTLIGAVWVRLLQARGHHAPVRRAMSWYYVGQLGKYVPGGIWPIVGRAELAVRGGVPRGDAYGATAYSLVSTYAAAAAAVGIGSVLSRTHPLAGLIVAAGAGVGWIVLGSQRLLDRATAAVARVTGKSFSFPPRREFLRLTAAHLPSWLLMSLSTSITARALGADIGLSHMLFVTSLSWLAGFVVVGVPGGIGVRESVFTALAGGTIGTPVAVSLALVSRLVFISVDIIGAVVSSAVAGTARGASAER